MMNLLKLLLKIAMTIAAILTVLFLISCKSPLETPVDPVKEPPEADQNWEMKQISSNYRINNIVITDGRNDGVQRIYGASFDGGLYEWSYHGESGEWQEIELLRIGENPHGNGIIFYGLQAGKGQNDNKTRLYGANGNGYTYEFSYNNGLDSWEKRKLDEGGNYQPQGILIGDSRNDGGNHVLSCATEINELPMVQEHSWSDNSDQYVSAPMVNQNRSLFQGAMGNGRNDGSNYIYHPDANGYLLREYRWSTNGYVENSIPLPMMAQRIAIGDLHNDGIQRLYVSDGFYSPGTAYIRELTYDDNSKSWLEDILHSSHCPKYSRHELFIGDARNDGKNRLYSIARDGGLVEHSHHNSKWETDAIDAVTGATATIAIGNARNDNKKRIYVAGTSKLLEYTYKK